MCFPQYTQFAQWFLKLCFFLQTITYCTSYVLKEICVVGVGGGCQDTWGIGYSFKNLSICGHVLCNRQQMQKPLAQKNVIVWLSKIERRPCYCCSVAESYPTLSDPVDCSTPGFPVLHYLQDFAQTHVHWVSQWCHPTISSSVTPFSSALNLSQHQDLFQWVSQSIEASASDLHWIFRIDFL